MRKLIAFAFALSLMIVPAAFAADTKTPPTELKFDIASAKIEKFGRTLQSRAGKYEVALVLQLVVSRSEWESLPPAIETFLYIGKHELRPFATTLDNDRVTLTFHDPQWEELKGGEPMVLTTEHGDPINNPDKYAGHPRFDPGLISEK